MSMRLVSQVAPLLQLAFDAQDESDMLSWDVSPIVDPDQGLMLYVGVVMPGAMPDSWSSAGAVIAPQGIDGPRILDLANDLMERLRMANHRIAAGERVAESSGILSGAAAPSAGTSAPD